MVFNAVGASNFSEVLGIDIAERDFTDQPQVRSASTITTVSGIPRKQRRKPPQGLRCAQSP